MRLDFFDYVIGTLFITLFSALLCGIGAIIGALLYTLSGIPCERTAQMKGLEGKYTVATGCMVKAGDVWVNESDIILVERNSKLVYVPKHGIPHKYEFKID